MDIALFNRRLSAFFSIKGVFSLRNIVVMGLMAALTAVLSYTTVYIVPSQKLVDISYLPGAIVAMLYGPWAALAFGLVSDTIGYFSNPVGAYFFGYAISRMVTLFIYACFFYNRPVSLMSAAVARLLVMAVVFFGLNFLWQSILTGGLAAAYFTSTRLIINAVSYPFHVALTMLAAKPAQKIMPMIHDAPS